MIPTELTTNVLITIIFIALWSLVWKGIALYKSARRKQIGWFIPILILNTLGLLPILYLLINKGKK